MARKQQIETVDASCLVDLELRSRVGAKLKEIANMNNGMWSNGTVLICPGYEGDSKYCSASHAAVANQLETINVYFSEPGEAEHPYVRFVPCAGRMPQYFVKLDEHPASAKEMLRQWRLDSRERRLRGKHTAKWMENICNAWIDCLYAGVGEYITSLPHHDLHNDYNSEMYA